MDARLMDKLLLGTALATALASGVWFGWSDADGVRAHPAPFHRARPVSHRYVPADEEPARHEAVQWHPPVAQRRGSDWIYEVFTPPEIFQDEETKRFSVVTPDGREEPEEGPEPVNIGLVAVVPELYPLQLVGYVGGEGRWLGSFANAATGEIFLAGTGRAIPGLNLEIADFTVRRERDPVAGETGASHRVAKAVVRDAGSGRVTVLTSDERSFTDSLYAIVATEGDDGETRHELRQGQEVSDAGWTYTIDRLQREPPAAEIIARRADTTELRRLTLTPRGPRAPPGATPSN